VSVRTVRNWIEAAKQGKLDLDLHTQANKTYVSNTSRNLSTIEQLVERGKKYRPHRAVKTVTPKPEFYQLFDDGQIYDIVRGINLYKEIPTQYSYFDGGAKLWDEYAKRMATEETPNTLTSTVKLLQRSEAYIDSLLEKYTQINIVDVGVGNALPVRDLIAHLVSKNKMGRYIGIDASPSMLDIARGNIRKWFGNEVAFEGHELDITYERFSNIIATDYLKEDETTANIVLLLGGTLSNLRDPDQVFKIIRDSITERDLLIHSQKLDTENSRKYFDFNVDVEKNKKLPAQDRFLIEMLGINEALYDIETGYDNHIKQRFISIRFNIALSIKFDFDDGNKKTLNFAKGESVLLWRARQSSALDIVNLLNNCEFYTLQSSQTEDQEYLLTISQIKHS
jgi:SAM-dependent methyltransferase